MFILHTWRFWGAAEGSSGEGKAERSWWAICSPHTLWVRLQAQWCVVVFMLCTWGLGAQWRAVRWRVGWMVLMGDRCCACTVGWVTGVSDVFAMYMEVWGCSGRQQGWRGGQRVLMGNTCCAHTVDEVFFYFFIFFVNPIYCAEITIYVTCLIGWVDLWGWNCHMSSYCPKSCWGSGCLCFRFWVCVTGYGVW